MNRQVNTVRTGVDQLASGISHPLIKRKRLGLLTNPTGITSDFRSTIDVCASLPDSILTALFACEHGLYGQHQAGKIFEDEQHPIYNIPIYSLYGEHKYPTAEMLLNVDTFIFDIQDLGVRFYTYLSTLLYVMQACAEHQTSLLILDRPNPLGGLHCEGTILQKGYESMVGAWRIPVRTGMTIGEMALLAKDQHLLQLEIEVLSMEGWQREMEYSATGLPWMIPSPNIPSLDTVRVYSGTCLFEGTNVSEGRGTTRPFEWIGAPWIDSHQLADMMNNKGLSGVHFQPMYMTPMYSKYEGELCGGVMIYVTDHARYPSFQTGIKLLYEIRKLYPDYFEWLEPPSQGSRYFIDLLTGSDQIRTYIAEQNDHKVSEWLELEQQDNKQWLEDRKPFLLY